MSELISLEQLVKPISAVLLHRPRITRGFRRWLRVRACLFYNRSRSVRRSSPEGEKGTNAEEVLDWMEIKQKFDVLISLCVLFPVNFVMPRNKWDMLMIREKNVFLLERDIWRIYEATCRFGYTPFYLGTLCPCSTENYDFFGVNQGEKKKLPRKWFIGIQLLVSSQF